MQTNHWRRRCAPALVVSALFPLLGAGCAKAPTNPIPPDISRQLVVSFSVDREINPNYQYFVLINFADSPGEAGPVPVVIGPQQTGTPSTSWGNGFAAPDPLSSGQGFVGFVRYGSGAYRFSRVATADPATGALYPVALGIFEDLGRPDQIINDPASGGQRNTLSFQLNLARLPGYVRGPGPDGQTGTADDVIPRYVQINLLATDNVPVNSVRPDEQKTWDALGDGRVTGEINTYLTIPLDQDATYSEVQRNIEPPDNDVRERLEGVINEPDLDIRDWTIEIRSGR